MAYLNIFKNLKRVIAASSSADGTVVRSSGTSSDVLASNYITAMHSGTPISRLLIP